MITGFQATLSVDDAGTGAAPGGTDTKFAGNVTFALPELTIEKFDATELDQTAGAGVPDHYMREFPTGLIKSGETEGEIKYTKANYQRLLALAEKGRGYTFKLTAPDDQTTPGTPVTLTLTRKGFISKVGAVKFEKSNPVIIPFSITFQEKGTIA